MRQYTFRLLVSQPREVVLLNEDRAAADEAELFEQPLHDCIVAVRIDAQMAAPRSSLFRQQRNRPR